MPSAMGHAMELVPKSDAQHVITLGGISINIGFAVGPILGGKKNVRLRDGAINWGVFHDIANPDRYVETFMAESWAEHLRYHERFTNIDREIEDCVLSFHIGKVAPVVNHFINASMIGDDRRS